MYLALRLLLLFAAPPVARMLGTPAVSASPPAAAVRWIDQPRITGRGELRFRVETREGGVLTVPGLLGGAANVAITDLHGETIHGCIIPAGP